MYSIGHIIAMYKIPNICLIRSVQRKFLNYIFCVVHARFSGNSRQGRFSKINNYIFIWSKHFSVASKAGKIRLPDFGLADPALANCHTRKKKKKKKNEVVIFFSKGGHALD